MASRSLPKPTRAAAVRALHRDGPPAAFLDSNGRRLRQFPRPAPCPHCGDPINDAEIRRSGSGFYVWAVCCGAQGPRASTAIDAAKAWNRRHTVRDWRRIAYADRHNVVDLVQS
jgi:hypothetical protein